VGAVSLNKKTIIYPNMTLQDQYFIAAALFLFTLVIY